MASLSGRITESEIGIAVLQILNGEPNGTADVLTIKTNIDQYVVLSEADRAQSPTRPNEEVWEQQVRNLVSHQNTPGNIFAEGFVQAAAKGVWSITDAGRLHLRHKGLA